MRTGVCAEPLGIERQRAVSTHYQSTGCSELEGNQLTRQTNSASRIITVPIGAN